MPRDRIVFASAAHMMMTMVFSAPVIRISSKELAFDTFTEHSEFLDVINQGEFALNEALSELIDVLMYSKSLLYLLVLQCDEESIKPVRVLPEPKEDVQIDDMFDLMTVVVCKLHIVKNVFSKKVHRENTVTDSDKMMSDLLNALTNFHDFMFMVANSEPDGDDQNTHEFLELVKTLDERNRSRFEEWVSNADNDLVKAGAIRLKKLADVITKRPDLREFIISADQQILGVISNPPAEPK